MYFVIGKIYHRHLSGNSMRIPNKIFILLTFFQRDESVAFEHKSTIAIHSLLFRLNFFLKYSETSFIYLKKFVFILLTIDLREMYAICS